MAHQPPQSPNWSPHGTPHGSSHGSQSFPAGYSGPAPKTPRPASEPRVAGPGEEELIEAIPFDLDTPEPQPSGIRHIQPIGAVDRAPEPDPEPVAPEPDAGEPVGTKLHSFGGGLERRHEDTWKRTPNVTGTGAIHVKSFHCKLTGDSLNFLDQQINEWLDAHPQYEVKQVTTTVGVWTGKLKEPNLIVNVWV